MLEALREPLGSPPPLMLGLSSLPGLPRSAVILALQDCQIRLEKQAAHLRQRMDEIGFLPENIAAMFDLGLKLNQAELEWVAGFLNRLETGNGDD